MCGRPKLIDSELGRWPGGWETLGKALSLTEGHFGIARGGEGFGNSRKFGVEKVKWRWKSWVAGFVGRRPQKRRWQGSGEVRGDNELMWLGGWVAGGWGRAQRAPSERGTGGSLRSTPATLHDDARHTSLGHYAKLQATPRYCCYTEGLVVPICFTFRICDQLG